MKRTALALALVSTACSSDPIGDREQDEPSSSSAACELAQHPIDIDAEAGALHYDSATWSLLVVDDATFRILAWRDDGTTEVAAGIPPLDGDPAGEALGELAVDAAGVLYVPRYGYGDVAAGAIFRVAPGAPAERLAGLPGTARRIALAFTEAGVLLASADEADQSSVLEVAADAESTLASGMGRAGGLARVGADILVLDPELRRISRVDTAARALAPLTEDTPALDRIASSAAGTFATGFDEERDTAVLVRVESSGALEPLLDLPSRARSVAVDDAGRIFVSLRDSDAVLLLACE